MKKQKLQYCGNCKERSMKVIIYKKEGEPDRRRIQICMNKGCGRKIQLPNLKEVTK